MSKCRRPPSASGAQYRPHATALETTGSSAFSPSPIVEHEEAGDATGLVWPVHRDTLDHRAENAEPASSGRLPRRGPGNEILRMRWTANRLLGPSIRIALRQP